MRTIEFDYEVAAPPLDDPLRATRDLPAVRAVPRPDHPPGQQKDLATFAAQLTGR